MSNITYRDVNPAGMAPSPFTAPPPGATTDLRMDFVKRAMDADSLDTLYFLLTNDIRALLEFDRCSLIVHIQGDSRIVAINDQPLLEKKAKTYDEINKLAPYLKNLDKGALFTKNRGVESPYQINPSEDVIEAFRAYMDFSGCEFAAFIPLTHGKEVPAHLLVEFFKGIHPDRPALSRLMNLAPLLGAALTEKWLYEKRPGLKALVSTGRIAGANRLVEWVRRTVAVTAVLALLAVLLFLIPFSTTVGGEAAIVPRDRHVVFSKTGGLIENILVKEGDPVEKGQLLVTLNPKELDYKIQKAETDFNVMSENLMLLRSSTEEGPTKLAESRLVELKRNDAWLDVNYFKWEKQFLEIRSPVKGVILTKDIESLKGKMLKAGDIFCEIATPGNLWVEVLVPDDRISDVKFKQKLVLYLNSDPLKGHELIVEEIAPASEAHDRLGNIYRVRAPFPSADKVGKIGMKGIGKIVTGGADLWFIASRRLVALWNRWSLYF